MKLSFKILAISTLALLMSCGEKDTKKEEKISIGTTHPKKEEVKKEVAKASETIDLTNKGIGPITSVTLDAEINSAMALKGEEVFTL